MKKLIGLVLVSGMLLASCGTTNNNSEISSAESSEQTAKEVFRLSEDDIYDRIYGSWLGQAAGVVWGADQEFFYCGQTMPDEKVPAIESLNLNGVFGQDDLYVEIPFIDAMKKNGVDCSLDVLAESFKNTTFGLDHANKIGRENLKNGIKAPASGSYEYNYHCDDIDWQIEADFVGCIYPGLTNKAAERAFEIGHIMNYGDGVYGGVFVSAMHSAAFSAKSVDEIIKAGVESVPAGTKFRSVMDDVVTWHAEGKTWQETHKSLIDKWDKTKRCLWYTGGALNIDAKMNSAMILIGLLYGDGDFDKSMQISMQCGMDSDCNPSSVGAILGNFYGFKAIDSKWKRGLDLTETKFAYTDYSFTEAVKANYNLAISYLEKSGYTKEGNVWLIPVEERKPVTFEQWPDMPTADVTISSDGSDIVRLSVNAHDLSGIKVIEWDMGDGTTYKNNVSAHRYSSKGEYKVICKIINNNDKSITKETNVTVSSLSDSFSDPQKGKYRNVAKNGFIICTDYVPTGSGSKDLETIRDGVITGSNMQQFDTYAGYLTSHEDHIGYMFSGDYKLNKVVFTEGMHFPNGGWFVGETLKIEALINGEWKNVNIKSVSPAYPTGNVQSGYGVNFETFTFTFDDITCKGIRIAGIAGGDAGFVGVAELEVYGLEA